MTTSPVPLPMHYGKRAEDLDVLSRSPLLRALDIREASAFLDLLDQVSLAPGTCVFRQGDDGDGMYFVLEGQGRLVRGNLELRTIRASDHFGEVALLGAARRPVSVEVLAPMRCARLSRRSYDSLSAHHPKIALHFTQALAASLGQEVVTMVDDVGMLARERSMPRRLQVRVQRGTEDLVVATGTLTGALLPSEENGLMVVGATLNKKAASLETPVVSDVSIGSITVASWEGKTIFRKSAALLTLEAARRVAPQLPVRMGASLESGQVVHVPDGVDRATFARSAQEQMNALVAADVPLREEIWTTDEAEIFFRERGLADAAALLPSRRGNMTTILHCGETYALGLGRVVPRAGWLGRGVTVEPHPMGMLLRLGPVVDRVMPTAQDPLATETKVPRFGGEMSLAQRHFLNALGVTGVGKFNEQCVTGRVSELIMIAEGFQEKWIGRIADGIGARRGQVKVIVIAGPSSSGKTTFIKRLTVQLMVNGIRPLAVSLDDYYVDRERTIKDEAGEYDFEAFETIDAALLQNHLKRLSAGELVKTARYDFVTGKSFPSGGKELSLEGGAVLMLEGIHGLNPALLGDVVGHDEVHRIFVHPSTSLAFDHLTVQSLEDLRLLRRVVRDRHARNYTAAETILRWASVRRGELRHIYPFLPNADVVFDSALVYELGVLKTYAERYLLEVPRSHPAFTTAHRLRELIDHYVAIYPDHVPPTSVLREFIGGSGFEY